MGLIYNSSTLYNKKISMQLLNEIVAAKEIGDEEPYYNTKISIFSFTWAGLAAFFSSDKT